MSERRWPLENGADDSTVTHIFMIEVQKVYADMLGYMPAAAINTSTVQHDPGLPRTQQFDDNDELDSPGSY